SPGGLRNFQIQRKETCTTKTLSKRKQKCIRGQNQSFPARNLGRSVSYLSPTARADTIWWRSQTRCIVDCPRVTPPGSAPDSRECLAISMWPAENWWTREYFPPEHNYAS